MITTATADELMDVLRTIVRASRSARQLPLEEDLPGWTVAVLSLLAREGEQRLGAVAAHLEVDPSVASRQVAALEQLGLVLRRPDPADRRAQLLAASDAGLATLAEHRGLRARWVADALEGWDDAEVSHLVARLDQLVHDLHHALSERNEPALRTAARQAS
ncbi:MarR family winged helix-turn-helix transcriptional regulator [Pseudonocardia sichuanensis]|uniref:DNA-binding MarR family transcriptional regulator n=1 Tax=Pseudonocardia kunmingensis TaxID=630975 RepID=A0A543DRS4_9PSEU|nr:MarR family transcriptional regulator [Pseudonocardia kunmingensis]TQM12036.1 DNA-binding MarR family transcriptional regulator [Pseudonocardia kunmingensis]